MVEQKRTEFAMAALNLADLFSMTFGHEQLVVGLDAGTQGAHRDQEEVFKVELSAPEGPSTGGGKQAVQHIKLVPDRGTTVVIGAVNQVEKTVELRTYDYLVEAHAQRFKGARLPLHQELYDDLFDRMQSFFVSSNLRIMTSDASKLLDGRPVAAKPGAAASSTTLMAVAFGVVAVALALYLVLRG